MADKKYIVAARVESKNKDCIVVEAKRDDYGDSSQSLRTRHKRKCEQWKRGNCR